MGINSAADKVKWAAIHFIDMMPRVEHHFVMSLQSINDAARSVREAVTVQFTDVLPRVEHSITATAQSIDVAARSIREAITIDALPNVGHNIAMVARSIDDAARSIREVVTTHSVETLPRVEHNITVTMQSIDFAARSIHEAATVFSIVLFLVGLVVILYLYLHNRRAQQLLQRQLNREYIYHHYGESSDARSQTYIRLIKFQSRLLSDKVGDGADNVKVIIVGGGEESESHVWPERHAQLHNLVFNDRRFMFNNITEAVQAVDDYCRESSTDVLELKRSKTLFVFLLVSSRDPTISGPHLHETFCMPSSLREHCYAIIGTGFQGVAAHRLSRASTGPNGTPLSISLPMGPKAAGVEL